MELWESETSLHMQVVWRPIHNSLSQQLNFFNQILFIYYMHHMVTTMVKFIAFSWIENTVTYNYVFSSEYPGAWVGAINDAGWKWSDGDALSWAPWSPNANQGDTTKPAGFYHVADRGMLNDARSARKPFICEIDGTGQYDYCVVLQPVQ